MTILSAGVFAPAFLVIFVENPFAMNMTGKFFAAIVLAAASVLHGAAVDLESFKNPPKENYPETWFHFISGNVSEDGITADLEAIAAAGFSGVQLFHGHFNDNV